MAVRAVAACLVAFTLAPCCSGAGAKAKAKDPWDVGGDGGSEEPMEGGPPMENEMSPEDQAGIIQQVEARSAMRRANSQHAVMKQFMQNFANNMRLSVLADSKGDMPEEERQRLIAKAESEKQSEEGDGPGFGPPPQEAGPPPAEADGGDEMEAPPPPRRQAPRHRMLNMAEARHRRAAHRRPPVRLLPEAEGIGFPAPEGMASDPASEGLVNDPGMTGPSYQEDAPSQFDAPPAPRPRRHHLHMLNMRPSEGKKAHRKPPPQHHAGNGLPPGVVRDEMGRAMPLLFTGSKTVHSGSSFLSFSAPLAIVAVGCLFVSPW